MGVIPETFRHPEWKRLYDAILPTLAPGQHYSYETLSELAGINVQTAKGRSQCLRCFREVLKTHSLNFENVRNEGYRIILPDETPHSVNKRGKRAGNELKRGVRIAVCSRYDQMKPAIAAEVSRLVASYGALSQAVKKERAASRKSIAAIESRLAIVEAIVQH